MSSQTINSSDRVDVLREKERQARARRGGGSRGGPAQGSRGGPRGAPEIPESKPHKDLFGTPIKVIGADETSRRIKDTLGDFTQLQHYLVNDHKPLIGISRTPVIPPPSSGGQVTQQQTTHSDGHKKAQLNNGQYKTSHHNNNVVVPQPQSKQSSSSSSQQQQQPIKNATVTSRPPKTSSSSSSSQNHHRRSSSGKASLPKPTTSGGATSSSNSSRFQAKVAGPPSETKSKRPLTIVAPPVAPPNERHVNGDAGFEAVRGASRASTSDPFQEHSSVASKADIETILQEMKQGVPPPLSAIETPRVEESRFIFSPDPDRHSHHQESPRGRRNRRSPREMNVVSSESEDEELQAVASFSKAQMGVFHPNDRMFHPGSMQHHSGGVPRSPPGTPPDSLPGSPSGSLARSSPPRSTSGSPPMPRSPPGSPPAGSSVNSSRNNSPLGSPRAASPVSVCGKSSSPSSGSSSGSSDDESSKDSEEEGVGGKRVNKLDTSDSEEEGERKSANWTGSGMSPDRNNVQSGTQSWNLANFMDKRSSPLPALAATPGKLSATANTTSLNNFPKTDKVGSSSWDKKNSSQTTTIFDDDDDSFNYILNPSHDIKEYLCSHTPELLDLDPEPIAEIAPAFSSSQRQRDTEASSDDDDNKRDDNKSSKIESDLSEGELQSDNEEPVKAKPVSKARTNLAPKVTTTTVEKKMKPAGKVGRPLKTESVGGGVSNKNVKRTADKTPAKRPGIAEKEKKSGVLRIKSKEYVDTSSSASGSDSDDDRSGKKKVTVPLPPPPVPQVKKRNDAKVRTKTPVVEKPKPGKEDKTGSKVKMKERNSGAVEVKKKLVKNKVVVDGTESAEVKENIFPEHLFVRIDLALLNRVPPYPVPVNCKSDVAKAVKVELPEEAKCRTLPSPIKRKATGDIQDCVKKKLKHRIKTERPAAPPAPPSKSSEDQDNNNNPVVLFSPKSLERCDSVSSLCSLSSQLSHRSVSQRASTPPVRSKESPVVTTPGNAKPNEVAAKTNNQVVAKSSSSEPDKKKVQISKEKMTATAAIVNEKEARKREREEKRKHKRSKTESVGQTLAGQTSTQNTKETEDNAKRKCNEQQESESLPCWDVGNASLLVEGPNSSQGFTLCNNGPLSVGGQWDPNDDPGGTIDPGGNNRRLEYDSRNNQHSSDYYLIEAKRLKHQADKESNRTLQVMKYLEAVLYFILTGNAMEHARVDTTKVYTMYKETLHLIKSISSKFQKNLSSTAANSDNKLAILSLRCQSLLFLKLYNLRRPEFEEMHRSLIEFQKSPAGKLASQKPATTSCPPASYRLKSPCQPNGRGNGVPSPHSPTPSPASSVASVGSQSSGYTSEMNSSQNRISLSGVSSQSMTPQTSSSIGTGGGGGSAGGGSGNVSLPQNIYNMFQRQQTHYGNLQTWHELWMQADYLIGRSQAKEFFDCLDVQCGRLSLHSSISELVNYVHKGLNLLKENT